MARTYDLLLRARGDTKDAERAMRQLQGKVRNHGRAISSAGRALTLGITAPVMAAAAVGISELKEMSKVTAQTEAAVRRLGPASRVSVKGVQKLSEALQKKSGIDDQLIESSSNLVLTLGEVNTTTRKGADIWRQATVTAVDMSEALGTNVDAAAKQVSKSLAAAAAGSLKLPRGMKLAKDEMQRLESAMKSANTVTERQSLVMDVLSKKFEGSMKVTAFERSEVIMDRFAGNIAKLIIMAGPALESLGDGIDRLMSKWEKLPTSTQKTIGKIALFAAAAGPAAIALGSIVTASATLVPLIISLANPISIAAAGFLLVAGHTMKAHGAFGRIMDVLKKAPEDFRYVGVGVKLMAAEFVRSMANMADSVLKLWGPLQKLPGAHQIFLTQIRASKKGLNELADSIEGNARAQERGIDKLVSYKRSLSDLGVTLRSVTSDGAGFSSALNGLNATLANVTSGLAAARRAAASGGKGGGKRGRSGSVSEGKAKVGGSVSALGVLAGSPSAGAVLAYAAVSDEPTPKFLRDRIAANKSLLRKKLTRRNKVMRQLRKAKSKDARARLRGELDSLSYEILGIASAITSDQRALNVKPDSVIEDIADTATGVEVDSGESSVAVPDTSGQLAAARAMAQTATSNLAGFVSSGDLGTALGASAYSSARIGSPTIVFQSTVPYTQQQAQLVADMVGSSYANGGGALSALRNTKVSLA